MTGAAATPARPLKPGVRWRLPLLGSRESLMRPIFHLSLPVRDLADAVAFYREVLGAEVGRSNPACVDVLVFGAQVTLQHDPAQVPTMMPRTRHFGATIAWPAWEEAARRLTGQEYLVEGPQVSYPGEPKEQAKLMVKDPSGNLIELKAYRHPEVVLGTLASGTTRESRDP